MILVQVVVGPCWKKSQWGGPNLRFSRALIGPLGRPQRCAPCPQSWHFSPLEALQVATSVPGIPPSEKLVETASCGINSILPRVDVVTNCRQAPSIQAQSHEALVRGCLGLRLADLAPEDASTIRTNFHSKANLESPFSRLTFVAANSGSPVSSERRSVGQSGGPKRQIPPLGSRLESSPAFVANCR